MLDELLALFYFATANNQHNNLKSLLNEKFADLLPVNVLVSSFTVLKLLTLLFSKKQIEIDTGLDFPTFKLIIQKLLLEARNR